MKNKTELETIAELICAGNMICNQLPHTASKRGTGMAAAYKDWIVAREAALAVIDNSKKKKKIRVGPGVELCLVAFDVAFSMLLGTAAFPNSIMLAGLTATTMFYVSLLIWWKVTDDKS